MSHADLMDAYYATRQVQEDKVEEFSNGYSTEQALYYSEVEPRVTFKQFLINNKGRRA